MTLNSTTAIVVKLKVALAIAEDNTTVIHYRKVVENADGQELFEITPSTVFGMFNDLQDALVTAVSPIIQTSMSNANL